MSDLSGAEIEALGAFATAGISANRFLGTPLASTTSQNRLVLANSSYGGIGPNGLRLAAELLNETKLLNDFVLDVHSDISVTVVRGLQAQGIGRSEAQQIVRDANLPREVDLLVELFDEPGSLEIALQLVEEGYPIEDSVVAAIGTASGGWEQAALDAAGIDLEDWDIGRGAEFNRETILKVYEYYGDLYLEDPDLQWAGLANMVGPGFAAAFFELGSIREAASTSQRFAGRGNTNEARFVELLAGLSAMEVHFYEVTFLKMQRDIFLDQGAQHEAYNAAGMAGLRAMRINGDVTAESFESWSLIDKGKATNDQKLLSAGNKGLALHEQGTIIAEDYNKMKSRKPSGPAVTYAMTAVGKSSVPGTRRYAEVFPLAVVETPGPERLATPHIPVGVPGWHRYKLPRIIIDNPLQGTVTVTSPFPTGNIANTDDRWDLFEKDIFPAYEGIVANPDLARSIVSTPVEDRMAEAELDYIETANIFLDPIDVEFDQ